MPPENRHPGGPADWLRHAASDLNLARGGRQPGVLLENLTFHTQQCAEKAIKALLLHHGLPLPRTHSIRFLLDALDRRVVAPEVIQRAAILTDYAVTLRYPGDFEPITEHEYDQAVDLAEQVLSWVRNQIESSRGAEST